MLLINKHLFIQFIAYIIKERKNIWQKLRENKKINNNLDAKVKPLRVKF